MSAPGVTGAPVDALAVMDRHQKADALEGRRGFDRAKFFIADAARSYVDLIGPFEDWKPEALPKLRAEAARRYGRLRELRALARVGGAS